MAETVARQVAVTPLTADTFKSTYLPQKMGNTKAIAYGGCALGLGVNAAYQTVSPGFTLYSVLGHYLGPTLTDRHVHLAVTRPRDTRTFATRSVTLSQVQDDGSTRGCMILLADFQAAERKSLLQYSTPPSLSWPGVGECEDGSAHFARVARENGLDDGVYKLYARLFALNELFFEVRQPPGSMMAQNVYGIAKTLRTSQDHLPLHERKSAQWARCRHPGELGSEGAQMGALAFYMDGALSFLPLSHNGMFLDDAGACSSLDFAMRVFTRDFDFGRWYLKELGTVQGSEGRTYSEGILYDEQGVMVAHMSQQSIMRPPIQKMKGKL